VQPGRIEKANFTGREMFMGTLTLPGLVDAHVHLREPGMEQKEDFYSGTAAALAGGVTMALDMPNTQPPTATPEAFRAKARLAATKAVCDIGLFVGATVDWGDAYLPVAAEACGLKTYVNETFGSLRIEDLGLMHRLFRTWAETAGETGYRTTDNPTGIGPIAVHAEEFMLAMCLCLADLYDVRLHVVHVSRRSEIEVLRRAKEKGYPVTCEVTPHHLFLSDEDTRRLGALGDMRPRLGSPDDVAALWANLDVVDVFATDHAPHTLAEKGVPVPVESPPPGVPGVETMLPLLLTAVDRGRLFLDDVIERCVHAPRRIYGLPEQPDTRVEVDIDTVFKLDNAAVRSRCGWTPYAGMEVVGKIEKVVLRGKTVYEEGDIRAAPGTGKVLFWQEEM
jgi:dihydroorotase